MTRLWEPFCGFEIVSKLTEGPKNRPEAFVAPWDRRSSRSRRSAKTLIALYIRPLSHTKKEPMVEAVLEIMIKHLASGRSAVARLTTYRRSPIGVNLQQEVFNEIHQLLSTAVYTYVTFAPFDTLKIFRPKCVL